MTGNILFQSKGSVNVFIKGKGNLQRGKFATGKIITAFVVNMLPIKNICTKTWLIKNQIWTENNWGFSVHLGLQNYVKPRQNFGLHLIKKLFLTMIISRNPIYSYLATVSWCKEYKSF